MKQSAAIHSHRSQLVLSHLAARRRKSGKAYVEGERTVAQALDGDWICEALFVEDEFADSDRAGPLLEKARNRRARIHRATSRALAKLSDCETPPPVGLIVAAPERDVYTAPLPERLLVLDRVKDPGNAGTLVRTAAAFGFSCVLTEGSVGLTNEKFLRSSAGMCFLGRAVYAGGPAGKLAEYLREKGVRTVGFDPQAALELAEVAFDKEECMALVLGGEVAGLDQSAWHQADLVRIPIRPGVESLNVAISGAIAVYTVAQKLGGNP